MDYAGYIDRLTVLMETTAVTPEFVRILPGIVDDAEQRCYRELNLLSTVIFNNTGATVANVRTFDLPSNQGRVVTIKSMNVVSGGARKRLIPTNLNFINFMFPDTTTGVPTYFAMVTDQRVILGATPNAAMTIDLYATIRPNPISATNTTTFLSLYLPDLFLSASMVFAAAYMRNFGSMSDDPKMAASWEAHYQAELASAAGEEIRKKFAASAGAPQ